MPSKLMNCLTFSVVLKEGVEVGVNVIGLVVVVRELGTVVGYAKA
jgi:hypothetical protein